MFIVNLAQGTISVETFGYICELWGYFWLVGARTRLINFELFYPVFQNPATGSQKQGRFGLIEAGSLQRFHDQFSLKFIHRIAEGSGSTQNILFESRCLVHRAHSYGQITQHDDFMRSEYSQPFNQILQLTDISRPVV